MEYMCWSVQVSSSVTYLKKPSIGAGEVFQRLRAVVALPEDPDLVSSIYFVAKQPSMIPISEIQHPLMVVYV